MNVFKLSITICIVMIGLSLIGCDVLDENPKSLLAPENFLSEEQGVDGVLLGAYRHLANSTGNNRGEIGIQEFTGDILRQHSGGENSSAIQYIQFTHGPETGIFAGTLWSPKWSAIRNANIVLENVEEGNFSTEKKDLFQAEARFIRAVAYYKLYLAFGPVPLRTGTDQPLNLPRPSEEEMQQFIESELLDIIPSLPSPGRESAYGRAHNGATKAYLIKFYLNTKQWQKSANMAQELINMAQYDLFPDYENLFKVENEMNNEFIWVIQLTASTELNSNTWITAAFPPNFAKAEPDFFAKPIDEGFEWRESLTRIASQYTLYDTFVDSFDPDDERQKLIMIKYSNSDGDIIDLYGNDDSRPFKFWPDPNNQGRAHGNDLPQIRYADILLSRAEALNEINGPNQESINLINQVRNRAGIDDLSLGDFSSQDELREHILKERGWEFWAEGLRHYDLVRMGKLVEFAQAREANAQSHHARYPIPQGAIDANPVLEQNPGY